MLDNIIIDPSVHATTGKEDPLKLLNGKYQGKLGNFRFPILNGIANLKLPHDQGAETSYDDILPNFELGEDALSKQRDIKSILEVNSLSQQDITGKTILLAGTGSGGDIAWLKELKPKALVCLDYSSSLNLVKQHFDDPSIKYVMGDICDMPFKSQCFDIIISHGILQASRSPEVAFISQMRTLKRGGVLSIGNLYSQNLHNRKIASLRYKLNIHREPNRDEAFRYIRKSTWLYTILANTGLYRLHRRFKFPYILHYNNIPGQSYDYYYANALDYYMSTYRHLTTSDEVKFWSERLHCPFEITPKGFKVTKS
jgi:ubiquinone/menaquinone biosynthesis C-methylase UbiE